MKPHYLLFCFVLSSAGALSACEKMNTPENTLGQASDAIEDNNRGDFIETLAPEIPGLRAKYANEVEFRKLHQYIEGFENLRISDIKMVKAEKGLLAPGVCGIPRETHQVSVLGDTYRIQRVEQKVAVTHARVLTATVVCRRWIEGYKPSSYSLIACEESTMRDVNSGDDVEQECLITEFQ